MQKYIFFISQRAFKMRNAKQKKNLKIFFLNFAVQKKEREAKNFKKRQKTSF